MATSIEPTPLSRRHRYALLQGQLERERDSFKSHWKELSDYILPRRTRFFVTDVNKGDRRTQKIIDSTATFSARTLSSGMMSGVTSAARPWFRLTTPDPQLADNANVKEWLHDVTDRMATIFLRSNLYNALPILYGDMGVFATGAMAVFDDPDDVIRCVSFPLGSYAIANDARGRVRVFFREFQMTVRQLVDQFGLRDRSGKHLWNNFSPAVRSLWQTGMLESWVTVCHVIESNELYNPAMAESKYKAFASCYYEKGSQQTADGWDGLLLEEGFDEFPVLAGRWEVTGEDVYGTNSPGMTVLGDIKQLQQGEKRAGQAIDKLVNPPMTGPTALRSVSASLLPGAITFNDANRDGGFRPVYEINPRTAELENKQQQVRLRIQRGFYEDLFLMLAQSDRREITAREIDERHEEKLLALGPVLEQLNQDVLNPLIDRVFAIMLRRGLVPEPPQELQGQSLKVEYISIMAQAQKMVGLSSLERFASFATQMAAVNPTVMDKIDGDQLIDEYADATGVPPRIIVSDDQVAAIRAQRQKAQQAAQMAQGIQSLSAGAKNLSQADTSGKNALTDLLGTGGAMNAGAAA